MALDNFIPEVWSLKLLKIFDKSCWMVKLVNREYEGEVKNSGDTVHVRTFGDVVINNYTRNQTLAFQELDDPMSTMVIDEEKYFAFKVDDLDAAQADIKILKGYTQRAAVAIKEVIDQHLHSHYTDVPVDNVIGSVAEPIALNKDNIYYYCTLLAEKLDNSNAPGTGRNMLVSPRYKTMLLNCPEFLRSTGLGDKVVQDGYLGNIAGMKVWVSTNLNKASGNTPLMAFNEHFISYASQVSKVKAVAPSKEFSEGVKGLYLYGSKVFINDASDKGPDKCGACLWGEG